jgi:hypothetical protein
MRAIPAVPDLTDALKWQLSSRYQLGFFRFQIYGPRLDRFQVNVFEPLWQTTFAPHVEGLAPSLKRMM